MSKIYNLLYPIFVLLVLVGCQNQEPSFGFESDFEDITPRTWIGSEYWANPMQDWHVENDRIECLVSNENRNIHHLTRQLGNQEGAFEMQVNLGLLNSAPYAYKNWIGFSIGAKGEFDDYRNDDVFVKGLNIGIVTNGSK